MNIRKQRQDAILDLKLGKLLQEKYESVMESRYFGRGGIEAGSAEADDRVWAEVCCRPGNDRL